MKLRIPRKIKVEESSESEGEVPAESAKAPEQVSTDEPEKAPATTKIHTVSAIDSQQFRLFTK
jgi:hypothetical protein